MLSKAEITEHLNAIVRAMVEKREFAIDSAMKLQSSDFVLTKYALLDVVARDDIRESLVGCEIFMSLYKGNEDVFLVHQALRRGLQCEDISTLADVLMMLMRKGLVPEEFESAIADLLSRHDGNIRYFIAAIGVQFESLRDRCLPILNLGIEQGDESIRMFSAMAFIRIHHRVEFAWNVVDLLPQLDLASTAVCVSCLQGIEQDAPQLTIRRLIAWYNKKLPLELSIGIVNCIGKSGGQSKQARDFLLGKIKNSAPELMLVAFEGYLNVSGEEVEDGINAIIKRIESEDPNVREVAAKSLLINTMPLDFVQTSDVMHQIGVERDFEIIELLFRILKKTGKPSCIPQFINGIEEPLDLRSWIKIFLSSTISEREPGHLIRALCENPSSTKSFILSLCLQCVRLTDADCLDGLVDILKNGESEAKRNILVALQNIGPAGLALVPVLLEILESSGTLSDLAYSILMSMGTQALLQFPKKLSNPKMELLRKHLETSSVSGTVSILLEFSKPNLERFLALANEFILHRAKSLNAARKRVMSRLEPNERNGFADASIRELIKYLEKQLEIAWHRKVKLFTQSDDNSTRPRKITADGKRFAHLVQRYGQLNKY